jgi:hypothetical protein
VHGFVDEVGGFVDQTLAAEAIRGPVPGAGAEVEREMERRQVMGAGFIASVTALATTETGIRAEAAAGDGDALVAAAVGGLQRAAEQHWSEPWRGIARVRDEQRRFLRATMKYPEFVEVGVLVWDAVHAWHVTVQQPLSMSRLDDGRYVMTFMFTTLVLRPDLAPDYVGDGYDNDRAAPRLARP